MSPYSYAWMAWGVIGIVTESLAFVLRRYRNRKELDTLSEHLQWLFVERGATIRRLSLAAWIAFAIWFAKHIWG